MSSSMTVSDGNGWSVPYDNPTHGNGKNGVAFEFQDKAKLKKILPIVHKNDISYFGDRFSLVMSYTNDFTSYDGNARAFFTHTWSETNIKDIKFGVSGKKYGLDITFDKTSDRWTAYSTGDTKF